MGLSKRKGGVLINPELSRHVATKVQEETAVAKERRKAREERKLGGKKGGGKGRGAAAAEDG